MNSKAQMWQKMCNTNRRLKRKVFEKDKQITELQEALAFYANPETYIAIGFMPDHPCGEFIEDFEDLQEFGYKPGKRARKALGISLQEAE